MPAEGRLAQRIEPWAERLSCLVVVFMRWFGAHWLVLANLAALLYVGLPSLSPVLAWAGYERAARLLHVMFTPFCHQLPERSFFLFGPQAVYSYGELAQHLGDVPRRFAGDAALGFKIAVCQRDVAIYAGMFLSGLAFGAVRRRLMPLPIRAFLVASLPMAVDGGGQLLGLWSSTWLSRVATGGLFGAALVLLTYPRLESAMAEVHRSLVEIVAGWRR
jgi:uncharacterized membrane protein